MKKLIVVLLTVLLSLGLVSCGEKSLPKPEVDSGMRGELGIDKNINEETIDKYLNRKDAVYRDMRMLVDEANYEAIGGDSYLSGFVKGFEVVPYPYLCEVVGLPEAVGEPYSGPTLFSIVGGEYVANYKESMTILETLFPKDKTIFLMCGGGGYAGMTKNLLVGLGWDGDKIYNTGGYWYYKGSNNVDVKYEENGEELYNFALVDYHDITFDGLTRISEEGQGKQSVEKQVEKSDFVKVGNIEELDKLVADKKAIALFVYLSGCPTCANFLPVVQSLQNEKNIEIYSIDLNDIWGKENSITSRIDYAPSLFIYKDGEVVAYLNPSSDEDKEMYKNYDSLKKWVETRIDIGLLEECIACSFK